MTVVKAVTCNAGTGNHEHQPTLRCRYSLGPKRIVKKLKLTSALRIHNQTVSQEHVTHKLPSAGNVEQTLFLHFMIGAGIWDMEFPSHEEDHISCAMVTVPGPPPLA